MITNERQYRITKAQLAKFEGALTAQESRVASPDVAERVHAAIGDALASEAEELRRQLREYEDLRKGRVKSRTLRSLREVPTALIQARIAANLTQKALARRLGVAEQQVQRWEATTYAGVSVERIQDVADALGIEILEKISFASATRVRTRSKNSAKASGTASAKAAKARE